MRLLIDIDQFMHAQNGATCTDGSSGYSCGCQNGYTGTHCETFMNNCGSNPCQNGGTCAEGTSTTKYSCSCPSGTGGVNCETVTDNTVFNVLKKSNIFLMVIFSLVGFEYTMC